MSEKARPKYSFSKKQGGGEFLNVAVWPGKTDSSLEDPSQGSTLQNQGRDLFRASREDHPLGESSSAFPFRPLEELVAKIDGKRVMIERSRAHRASPGNTSSCIGVLRQARSLGGPG